MQSKGSLKNVLFEAGAAIVALLFIPFVAGVCTLLSLSPVIFVLWYLFG